MDDAGIYVEAIPHVIELRAEVESLRTKVQEARRWGAGLEYEVLSLQARLARDRQAFDDEVGRLRNINRIQSEYLAAVRTDLSAAHQALADREQEWLIYDDTQKSSWHTDGARVESLRDKEDQR